MPVQLLLCIAVTCTVAHLISPSKMQVISIIFTISLLPTVYPMSSLMKPEPFSWRNHFSPETLPDPRPLQIPPPEASQSQIELESSHRESKLFPYFLVQFPNDPCSNTGGTQHGVCVSAKDCRTGGGMMVGTCAQGFGACCRYIRSCGAEGGDILVRENSTEIRSNNASSYCRFILPRPRGICQVRLDFVKFEFGQAVPDGDCSQTRIEITGATVNYANLCGNLTGQHLYLNYGEMEKIFIHSGESTLPNDTYSIRVSYIRCESRLAVPTHCSQYYSGTSGQVRSLNWPHQQLNDLEYTICVADPQNNFTRRKGRKFGQKASQKIQWSTCGSTYLKGTRDFFISGQASDPPTNPDQCDTTDYIQVFGGNKQCGNKFRNEIISNPPYLLRVKFDGLEMAKNERTLLQGQGQNIVDVGKPESGCESLNTVETKCEVISSSLCKCTKSLKRANSKMDNQTNEDRGNTGFCLSYKIIA